MTICTFSVMRAWLGKEWDREGTDRGMICILGVGDPCLWDWGDLGGQAADVMGRDAVSETLATKRTVS